MTTPTREPVFLSTRARTRPCEPPCLDRGVHVIVVDTATGEEKSTFEPRADRPRSQTVMSGLAWSPDSKQLAIVLGYREIRGLETNEIALSISVDEDLKTSGVWSPDGQHFASADGYSVMIWDATTGQQLVRPKGLSPVNQLVWSPDGRRLASAGSDGTISLWTVPAGK